MLEHLNTPGVKPRRVVVVGAQGFVGAAIAGRLEREGVPVLPLGRAELDLTASGAGGRLASLLEPDDALLAVAARAPCKDAAMLLENVAIAASLAEAISRVQLSHVVNVSSDAVYADSDEPLTEASCASPGSLHGVMHLAREVMLRGSTKAPLAIVRPTLIYGSADPHNGYGPNRFRRLAQKGEDIMLFGEGEEQRDHVFIEDVAELIKRILERRSTGVLNIATGQVHSFREIAEKVVALAGRAVTIRSSPRSGPMPHNGYRPFDPSACWRAFADFRYTSIEDGLARSQNS